MSMQAPKVSCSPFCRSQQVLSSTGKCLVHFLDLEDPSASNVYLQTASANHMSGSNQIYLILIAEEGDVGALNFIEMKNLQNIFLLHPKEVTERTEADLSIKNFQKYLILPPLKDCLVQFFAPTDLGFDHGGLFDVAIWSENIGTRH